MITNIFNKFIETFNYGDHTFIMCHGKDKEDMKNGFPLELNSKTESYFQNFIADRNILTPYVHVVVGDLHQSLRSYGKRFRWKRVASMYGSSGWIQTNFGDTKPAVDFEIIPKNSNNILEGRVMF